MTASAMRAKKRNHQPVTAGGGGRIAGGEGGVTRLVRRSHDDGALRRTAGGLDGARAGCACYGQGLRHHRWRKDFPSARAASPPHGTCSMKCLTGVTLPSERGGDSIPAKPANQTHPNLARLKQSLQPNKCLLTYINLAKSSLAQKASRARN